MDHKNADIPIIRKLYELYKLFYGYSALFPKKDKYALGAKCEIHIIDTLEILLEASCTYRDEKLPLIRKANAKFDGLKLFVRLLKDLKIVDSKKYIQLQGRIQEIGKMLGGWQRSLG